MDDSQYVRRRRIHAVTMGDEAMQVLNLDFVRRRNAMRQVAPESWSIDSAGTKR